MAYVLDGFDWIGLARVPDLREVVIVGLRPIARLFPSQRHVWPRPPDIDEN
jgi:hypothetical protein